MMTRLMRSWMAVMSMLILLLSSFPVVAQSDADSCSACGETPEHLQRYLDTIEKLVEFIDIDPSDEVQADLARPLSERMQKRQEALDTILNESIISQNSSQLFADTILLFESEPKIRDRGKIVAVDELIATRAQQMVAALRHDDPVPAAVLGAFDTTLKELGYVHLNMTPDTENPEYIMYRDDATYADLTLLVWQLNAVYKELHKKFRYRRLLREVGEGVEASDHPDIQIAQQEVIIERIDTFGSESKELVEGFFGILTDGLEGAQQERIEFDSGMVPFWTMIWATQDAYECASGLRNLCNDLPDLKKDNFQVIKDRAVTDTTKAVNTFKDAWRRLKGEFASPSSPDKEAAYQRKQSLLQGYRGPHGPQKSEWWDIVGTTSYIDAPAQTVGGLWKSLKEMFEKSGQKMTNDKSTGQSLQPGTPLDTTTQPSEEKNEQLYTNDEEKTALLESRAENIHLKNLRKHDQSAYQAQDSENLELINQQEALLKEAFSSVVFDMQNEMTIEDVFTDVNRVTHKFPILSAAVYKQIELIGKKNTEGKLYNAMGSVCTMQCENLGPNCWYDTE